MCVVVCVVFVVVVVGDGWIGLVMLLLIIFIVWMVNVWRGCLLGRGFRLRGLLPCIGLAVVDLQC